jgi:hypothetical protein
MTDSRNDMHELGNAIVALEFCLRQLDGRQRTDELEGLVRSGLEVCEQGIAAFRRVHEAVRGRKIVHPSEQVRRHQMRAAEYRAVADQMRDPTASASYRRLAESYETMGRRLEEGANSSAKGRAVVDTRKALGCER